jgi:hypothetical protein
MELLPVAVHPTNHRCWKEHFGSNIPRNEDVLAHFPAPNQAVDENVFSIMLLYIDLA